MQESEKEKEKNGDTNHSKQWVGQLFLFIFRTTTMMMMMMMDEGQAYAYTQLVLMRCLYSPRQNANISSILMLIVLKKKKIGLTGKRQERKRACIFK